MTMTTSDDVLAYLDEVGIPDVSIRLIGDQIKAAGGPLTSVGVALAYRGLRMRRLALERAIADLRHDDRADEIVADLLARRETLYLLIGRAIRDARRAWLDIPYTDDVVEAALP